MSLLGDIRILATDIKAILSGSASASEVFVNKFGENIDIDTADTTGLTQIIWPVKSTTQVYPFATTPVALTIESTDLTDTALGTGARTVEVQYHDSNGLAQLAVVTMLGATQVAIAESYGTFRIKVLTSGTGNTNAGDLLVKNGATIYGIVKAGQGQTQMAITRIPSNIISGRVKYARCTYARTANFNTAKMSLIVQKPDGTKQVKLNPVLSTQLPDFEREYIVGGIGVEAGDWVYWETYDVSANDTAIAGYFDIIENLN